MAKWFKITPISPEEREARIERRRTSMPKMLPILLAVAVVVIVGVLIWAAATGTKLF